jgi:HK97 family phage major capsid protein
MDVAEVAAEVKREIARIGDDTKKLNEDFMQKLSEARQLAEGKASPDDVKKAVEEVTLKFEEIDARQKKGEAESKRRTDEILTALNRSRRSAGQKEIPTGIDLKSHALQFKTAALALRGNLPADGDIEVTDAEQEAYGAYSGKAYKKYLRKGEQAFSPEEFKALTTGSDPNGGYLVPIAQSARILDIVHETSPMATLAYVETIGSDRLELPIDEGRGTGNWVGEEEARTETATPTIGSQIIQVHEMFAEPRATQRILEDAQIDLEAWLARKNGDEFARTEATAFISGNGIKKPRGILSYPISSSVGTRASGGNIQYFPSGAASAITADAIKGLPLKALKERYHANARWLMKRATLAAISILRDDSGASAGTGQYLWVPGLRDNSIASQLAGYPISLADDMPAVTGGSYSVAFGDFRAGYTIVRRLGITTLRDPYTAKPFVKFYSRMRVGGDVTNWEAYVVLKTGTS